MREIFSQALYYTSDQFNAQIDCELGQSHVDKQQEVISDTKNTVHSFRNTISSILSKAKKTLQVGAGAAMLTSCSTTNDYNTYESPNYYSQKNSIEATVEQPQNFVDIEYVDSLEYNGIPLNGRVTREKKSIFSDDTEKYKVEICKDNLVLSAAGFHISEDTALLGTLANELGSIDVMRFAEDRNIDFSDQTKELGGDYSEVLAYISEYKRGNINQQEALRGILRIAYDVANVDKNHQYYYTLLAFEQSWKETFSGSIDYSKRNINVLLYLSKAQEDNPGLQLKSENIEYKSEEIFLLAQNFIKRSKDIFMLEGGQQLTSQINHNGLLANVVDKYTQPKSSIQDSYNMIDYNDATYTAMNKQP